MPLNAHSNINIIRYLADLTHPYPPLASQLSAGGLICPGNPPSPPPPPPFSPAPQPPGSNSSRLGVLITVPLTSPSTPVVTCNGLTSALWQVMGPHT